MRRELKSCAAALIAACAVLPPAAGHAEDDGHHRHRFARCSVVARPVQFGSYDPSMPSPTTTTGTISFFCTQSTPITIMLGKGSSNDYAVRTMRQGGFALAYNLYIDAATSIVWGDGTDGTQYYSNAAPPSDSYTPITVYGKIPPGQTQVRVGGYTDSIIVTINF